jgi:hypothetical protein
VWEVSLAVVSVVFVAVVGWDDAALQSKSVTHPQLQTSVTNTQQITDLLKSRKILIGSQDFLNRRHWLVDVAPQLPPVQMLLSCQYSSRLLQQVLLNSWNVLKPFELQFFLWRPWNPLMIYERGYALEAFGQHLIHRLHDENISCWSHYVNEVLCGSH